MNTPRDPLLVERETTHGSFIENARVAQNIKAIMSNSPKYYALDVRQREALDLIATKIGRILTGDCKVYDHWDDISGYAKLGGEGCR